MFLQREFSLTSGADSWVTKHLPHFFLHRKSTLELLEYELFSGIDIVDSNRYKKLIEFVDTYTEKDVEYRKLEQLAVHKRIFHTENDIEIRDAYQKSFIHNFINSNAPLLILNERKVEYTLTHTFFYASIFNTTTCYINDEDLISAKLIRSISLGLLITCRTNDVDVLAELLCTIKILNLNKLINQDILELAYKKLANSQFGDGSISPTGISTSKSRFKDVYHTTLVVAILGRVTHG